MTLLAYLDKKYPEYEYIEFKFNFNPMKPHLPYNEIKI